MRENKFSQLILMEEFIDALGLRECNRRSWQQNQLAEDGIFELLEDKELISSDLLFLIKNNQWEQSNPENFIRSLRSGKRPEMLQPYSAREFDQINLYKVIGFNAGFGIKQDGTIVAVHNNTGIRGIGTELINAAKRNGGTKLDHFDGFLTGFYERLGFKVIKHEPFNDDYAPNDWNYSAIDFFDPQQSVYAKEANKIPKEQWPKELLAAKNRYDAGKPDVVYRHV